MRRILAILAAATIALSSLAAPALAEPPSWAPAHGWRAKHDHGHHAYKYKHKHKSKHRHGGGYAHKHEYEYEYEYEYDDDYDDDRYYRHREPRRHYGDSRGYGGYGGYGGGVASGDLLRCNSELVGQVAGGAVGAIVGSNIGDGRGQLAAIGAGALIGVLLGGEIGAGMDRTDRACMRGTLEHVRSGRTVAWDNPDNGVHYETTPVRTYQTNRGRYCREYTTTAYVGGRERQVYGTACRQPDGDWEIQR